MTGMVDSIRAAKLYSTNSIVDIEAFKNVFPQYSRESIWYQLGLNCVISQVAEWGCLVKEQVAVVFDQRQEFQVSTLKYYTHMQNRAEWQPAKYLGSIGFGSRKDFTPLQAADFMARETFKFFHQIADEPNRKIRIPMLRLEGVRLQAIHWRESSLKMLREYVNREYSGDLIAYLNHDFGREHESQFLTNLRDGRLT